MPRHRDFPERPYLERKRHKSERRLHVNLDCFRVDDLELSASAVLALASGHNWEFSRELSLVGTRGWS